MSTRAIILITAICVLAVFLAIEVGVIYLLALFSALLMLRAVALYFAWDYTAPIPSAPEGSIKIACIGDSITYGSNLKNRSKNCYPSQLEGLLGKNYAVRNFGVNGRTMMKSSDRPFWEHRNFRRVSDFGPDIIIIMLGTNDSKQKNWTTVEEYIADCRKMVEHYRRLPSHPAIYIATPPAAHSVAGKGSINYTISNEAMEEMSSVIKKMAKEEELAVIDIRAATAAHPEYFPRDGVHPSVSGASLIAQTICKALIEESQIRMAR